MDEKQIDEIQIREEAEGRGPEEEPVGNRGHGELVRRDRGSHSRRRA